MKIAIDARMYGHQATGIGLYIKHLTNHLFKIDSQNEYVLFLNKQGFAEFSPPSQKIKKVLVKSHWYTLKEQLCLPFEFEKEEFDFIHYPQFNSPIFYKKKCLCTIHDLTPYYFPGSKVSASALRKRAFQMVFSSTLDKSSFIICVSQNTKKELLELFPAVDEQRIKQVYNGVDLKFQKQRDYGIIKEVKKRLKISGDFIFYVGVWRDHKNLSGLIKAFKILRQKHGFEGKLVLAGNQSYEDPLKLIKELGLEKDLVCPGFVSDGDVRVLYSAAKVFVIPSFNEGFGQVPLEAMNCSCPVAASKTGSLPEVLGDAAVYFDPHDQADMAAQINNLIIDENLRGKLIDKGHEQVKKFSWEKCARQTLEIYENM